MKRRDYDYLIMKAKNGDPHSMLILAKLYKAGAFGESRYDRYIYWLKKFFEAPEIKTLTEEYEDLYSGGSPSDTCPRPSPVSINIPTEMVLRKDIIEAGMSLGIYYSRSNKKDELLLAMNSLASALDASAWDHLTYTSSEETSGDIISLLEKVSQRFKDLGFQEGDYNG